MKIDKRKKEAKSILHTISFNTEMREMQWKALKDVVACIQIDPSKKERLKMQFCRYCFYKENFAGSAFTEYVCEICKKHSMWHNTNIPDLCMECAKDNNLCAQCGAEMD